MSIFSKMDGKIRIPRSIYIKILVLICLVGVSSVAMRPIQNALSGAMTDIRTNLIERLEDYTGMEIRYSSIRPAFFNSFDIRNLRFYKDESEVLTISRARFSFSLRELFNRKLVIHTVQIDRPVLRLDMERDRETFDLLRSLSNSQNDNELLQQISAFLPERADYRIRNFSISFSNGETLFQVENMNVNIRGDGRDIFLDTKFGMEIIYPDFFNRTVIVKTDMSIAGVYLAGLDEIKADIFLSSLTLFQQDIVRRRESFFRLVTVGSNDRVTLFSMYPVNIHFSYKDKIANIKSPVENPALDYLFSYDTQARTAFGGINLNNFLLTSFMFNLSENIKNLYFLNMETTGNLSLKYESGGAFNYSINLQSGNLIRSMRNNAGLSDAFLININGNEKSAVVNDFWFNSSAASAGNGFFQGIINFSGSMEYAPFRPTGTVIVEHFSLSGKESINGIFYVSSHGRNINVSSNRLSFGLLSFNSLNMNLFPSNRDVSLTLTALTEDNGAVYFDAVLYNRPRQFEASLTLDSLSIFNISETFRPFTSIVNIPVASHNYMRSTLVDAEIFFSSDFNNIAYNVPYVVFREDTIKGILSLSGTDQHFTVSEGTFYFDENELSVWANANFSNPSAFDFFVNANYLDVSWNIEGQILDRSTLIIRDPNGLHVYGGISNSGAISGYIEGINFPIPASVYPVYTDFYATLRFLSFDFWSVDIAHFRFRDLYSDGGMVSFNISGIADQDGAHFRNILYSDSISTLVGSADFSWEPDFSYIQSIINITDGERNGENYYLEGVLKNNNINISASVSDMRVDRFVRGNGSMLASGNAEVSWNSVDSFSGKVSLLSFRMMQQRNAVQASGEILFSNDELLLYDLMFDYAEIRAVFPVFKLSPAEGIAKVNAGFEGFAGQKKLGGTVDLDASFNKIKSWFDIRHALNSFNGTLQIDNFQFGSALQDRTVFVFSGDEKGISVSGGERNMLRLEMDREGSFFASLSAPLPIRGSFAGIYKDGHFDAHCNDFYVDMAALWDLTNNSTENFNITGGYVTGRMNLRGPIWNPEFYGTARGTSLSLQVPNYVSEDIRPVPFNIVAEGYEMTFGPVVTVSGSGAGTVSGWFRFEYWVPRNVGLDINIPRTSPIPYDINISGFLASGESSGRLGLELNSNDGLLEISGDLFMNNTEMGVVMDEVMANADEPFADRRINTVVDIRITTGPMVEFFWPNINSPILRVNPEMGTVFLVQSDTNSGQYSLNSNIRIRTGELYYLDRVFYIRQGNMVFRENETQFNPRLSARAEIRDRSSTGPVTISMIIDNQPLLNFVPRFESSPSLTQLEIYSILGQNLHNIDDSGNTDLAQRFLLASSTDLMAQFVASSDVLAQINFLRQFERTLRNFLNLDMLSIRTRFLQNAVITGASEMGFGMSPVDRNNRVGNYFDNTTVFIGKYVGQDMFVQGTLTLKYDANRLEFGGLRFEPDIGIELQSPFFNIRWSFFPHHPENWWVNDHSISLIWNKSY